MRRGEIWWADLGDSGGTRPVLLLTREEGIRVRANVTVTAIPAVKYAPTAQHIANAAGRAVPSVPRFDHTTQQQIPSWARAMPPSPASAICSCGLEPLSAQKYRPQASIRMGMMHIDRSL